MIEPAEFLKKTEPERRAILAEACAELSDEQVADDLLLLVTWMLARGMMRKSAVASLTKIIGDIRASALIRQRRAG